MELLQFEVTNAGTLGSRWTPPAPETKKASSLPGAALAALLQEEDDEDQCVMFGSSTANFSAVPAAKHQWNRPLSSVQPPRAGMMVFGVLRANGTMELANTQPTLHVDDKILFAELAD